MSSEYVVTVEGIGQLADMSEMSADVAKVAAMAVNAAARRTRTLAAKKMGEEVNWKPSYLAPSNKRFVVGNPATASDLETTITGRFTPTSLARFVKGNPRFGKAGVSVEVHEGAVKTMKRAFLVRLRRGSDIAGDAFNVGLAIRLKPGERLEHSFRAKTLKGGLTLLYSASVDQVFRTVAPEVVADAQAFMQDEFDRLWALRNKGQLSL